MADQARVHVVIEFRMARLTRRFWCVKRTLRELWVLGST
jgi:hypothetical protein